MYGAPSFARACASLARMDAASVRESLGVGYALSLTPRRQNITAKLTGLGRLILKGPDACFLRKSASFLAMRFFDRRRLPTTSCVFGEAPSFPLPPFQATGA